MPEISRKLEFVIEFRVQPSLATVELPVSQREMHPFTDARDKHYLRPSFCFPSPSSSLYLVSRPHVMPDAPAPMRNPLSAHNRLGKAGVSPKTTTASAGAAAAGRRPATDEPQETKKRGPRRNGKVTSPPHFNVIVMHTKTARVLHNVMCRKPANLVLCLCSPGMAAYGYGCDPGPTAFGTAGGAPHIPFGESLASIEVSCGQKVGRYVFTLLSACPSYPCHPRPVAPQRIASHRMPLCCVCVALCKCFPYSPRN